MQITSKGSTQLRKAGLLTARFKRKIDSTGKLLVVCKWK